MASKVYFHKTNKSMNKKEINNVVQKLLERFVEDNNIKLQKKVLMKVSFGEAGNKTFIPSDLMLGAINFLKDKKIKSGFIETNVLYRGRRTNKKDHEELAREHGFTQLPVIIADGDIGEDYENVDIDKKHFKTCMIAKKILDEKQLLVVSHFKGHTLSGFGGAIKQLGMGCASRGGKLAQHAGSKPIINPLTCKKCYVCIKKCPVNAITMGRISAKISSKKCIGCAACIAACPYGVIKINWLGSVNRFTEKLVEYAYAAHKKDNIYLTYAIDMTRGCDCEPKEMKAVTKDLGIFVSSDPVASDRAILNLLKKREGKKVFREKNTFKHAEKIGFGNVEYELINIEKNKKN